MRWVTYDGGTGPRTGVLDGTTVRGLRPGVDLLTLLEAGDDALAEAGTAARRAPHEVRPLDEVRLRAPLPRPPSVRDGLCFLDHLRGSYRALGRSQELDPAWSQGPAFYFSNAAAIVGPHDDVPVAPGSRMFDLELEVGAVIGRAGHDLDPATAERHIVGYTLFNDWTARDHQLRDLALGIGMGKSKDSATTLGPALVTADELEEYRRDGRIALELTATVNGEEITRGRLDQMDWTTARRVTMESFDDINRRGIAEFRETGGKASGRFEGAPLLLMHHVGARSGAERITPLISLLEEDRIYVFAGKAGSDDLPAWYHNLLANPRAKVETGTETFPVIARIVAGAERDRIYATLANRLPQFDYQPRTTRTIPVIELQRIDIGR
ncbi:MAG: nitroreductase/quinone reductase family protein [Pseudonocardia sp.]